MSQSLSFRSFAPTKSKPSLIDHKPYASLSRRVSISAVHSEVRSKPNHLTADVSRHAPPVQPRPPVYPSSMLDAYSALEVDRITEAELKENGFESVRRTKVVCTVGTSSCGFDELEALAAGGMNVARLNLGHNTQDWHREVIRRVRRLNAEKGFAVAVMVDTQGSEIHMGDLDGGKSSARAKDGDIWTFSIRSYDTSLPERTVNVSYDGFAEDVQVGDELLVDGGMVRFEVIEKIGPDVKCLCIDPGLLLPRANLALWRDARLVHHHDAMLPTITQKDWHDIDFAIAEGVDFIALSFIRYAEAIHQLRSYIVSNSPCRKIGVIAKIESIDSLKNLEEIVEASDGVMVARGDMGAQIAVDRVPLAQERIVRLCKGMNKPVIVASQLLESMIEYPIPTRAEVADVSDAVRQQADALMLSGESAMGKYPEKALAVLRDVSLRIEKWQREQEDKHRYNVNDVSAAAFSSSPCGVREALCDVAAKMADSLGADAIFVYTKDGEMATRLSKCRPLRPIFAFTESSDVRRRLNLAWGVIPLQLSFSNNSDKNFSRTFSVLKTRGMVRSGNMVVVVSDMLQSVQVVEVP